MKFAPLLFLLLFVSRCSTRPAEHDNDAVDQVENIGDSGSNIVGSASSEAEALPPAEHESASDSTCISLIHKFNETDEFYVGLFFLKDLFTYEQYQALQKKADSVVYSDDDIQRLRLPSAIAAQYLDMSGLDRVAFFDSLSNRVGTGKMKRVEHYENMIEGQFIAVFQVDKIMPADPAYFMSYAGPGAETTDRGYAIIESDSLDEAIFNNLAVDKEQLWYIRHFKQAGTDRIYSVLPGDMGSYIMESKRGALKCLYKGTSGEMVTYTLLPVAGNVNGNPVFLAEGGVAETDAMWEALLVFKNGAYEVSYNHRVKLD